MSRQKTPRLELLGPLTRAIAPAVPDLGPGIGRLARCELKYSGRPDEARLLTLCMRATRELLMG